jgi:hypothetical protein
LRLLLLLLLLLLQLLLLLLLSLLGVRLLRLGVWLLLAGLRAWLLDAPLQRLTPQPAGALRRRKAAAWKDQQLERRDRHQRCGGGGGDEPRAAGRLHGLCRWSALLPARHADDAF